jgi:hypothetical protein
MFVRMDIADLQKILQVTLRKEEGRRIIEVIVKAGGCLII